MGPHMQRRTPACSLDSMRYELLLYVAAVGSPRPATALTWQAWHRLRLAIAASLGAFDGWADGCCPACCSHHVHDAAIALHSRTMDSAAVIAVVRHTAGVAGLRQGQYKLVARCQNTSEASVCCGAGLMA